MTASGLLVEYKNIVKMYTWLLYYHDEIITFEDKMLSPVFISSRQEGQ